MRTRGPASRLRAFGARLLADEQGQALVEYGLIAAAIVVGLYIGASGLIALQGAIVNNHHGAIKDWRGP